MELSGATALVTGGAHRIGKAVVLGLAEAGCNVVLHYRSSAEDAETTAAAVRSHGVEAVVRRADLGEPESIDTLFGDLGSIGPVQVVVNSAGVFPDDTIRDFTPDGWDRTFAVNVKAPALVAQALARSLPEGLPGAVVNVTDWRTERPYSGHFTYSVAKGALDTMTIAAAEALAPRIRVNAVALGAMLPPPGRDQDYLRELAGELPLQRIGGTEPAVQAVLFLLHNAFMTGEVVRVDGGAHLR